MQTLKVNCVTCGTIDVDAIFSNDDGASIMPVSIYPTIDDFLVAYKEMVGSSWADDTGEDPYKQIEKSFRDLSHACIDDGVEELDKHSIGKIECWSDL